MDKIIITNGKLITPERVLRGEVYIERGKISRARKSPGALRINARGMFVSPGFIDLHIHGDPIKISRREARFGTTAFLCGIHDAQANTIRTSLKQMDCADRTSGARALGLYMEGPYVNPKMRGALLKRWIKKPDINALKKIIKLSGGKMKIITVAPEVKGMLKLIKYMKAKKIIPSIGHTDATYAETRRGIGAGASLVTHMFNRIRPLSQREPAATGAILTDKKVAAEVLLDNIHLHPALFNLLLLCKGDDKIILVTDSVASGPLPGSRKCGTVYKTKDGAFAGGCLTMNRAVKNAQRSGGLEIHQAVKMASLNPARVLGMDKNKGSLSLGKDADILIFDDGLDVKLTLVEGKIVFKKKSFRI
jgi:N-acetylglucosamine-6-phosphate deacetylase